MPELDILTQKPPHSCVGHGVEQTWGRRGGQEKHVRLMGNHYTVIEFLF